MRNTILTNDSIVSRNPEILFNEIEGETVMMSIQMGEYYGLNPVASRIWELTTSPITVKRICALLMQEYEVSAEQCEKEVMEFLQKIFERNIITIL